MEERDPEENINSMKIEKALKRAQPPEHSSPGAGEGMFYLLLLTGFPLEVAQIPRLETSGSLAVILLPFRLLLAPKPCELVFTVLSLPFHSCHWSLDVHCFPLGSSQGFLK